MIAKTALREDDRTTGRAAAGQPRTAWRGPGTDILFRRLLRNAGLVLGGKAATALVNLAATALALRSLGVESYGLLVLVHAFVQAAGGVVKFQSWQAVLRYGAPCLEHGRWAEFRVLLRFTAGLDLASALAGSAACAALALLLGPVFGWPAELMPAAALYATAVAFRVMAMPTGLLRLFDRFDLLAKRDSAGAVVRLIGAAAAAAMGGGLLAFMAAWYAGAAAGGAMLVATAWRELRRRGLTGPVPGPRLRATAAHPGIWRFAWTTNLATTLSLAHSHGGTLMVGALLGPPEAALYAVARQIGDGILRPSQFLTPAIYPELARLLAAGRPDRARALALRSMAAAACGAGALLAVLVLFGNPLLRLIGGPPATAAYGVAVSLGAAAAIGFASFALEPLLISAGRPSAALRARAAGALAYVPAAFGGIWLAGLDGAGLAAVAVTLVMFAGQAIPAAQWLRADAAERGGEATCRPASAAGGGNASR
jgi:O-antigen/teichoic acid export membrane protein